MPTNPSRPGPGRRPAQAVTTARASVERDRAKRMWEYLGAMGFRILAFPVSVWLLMNDMVVIGVVLALAAIAIPSIAVVLANNVDRRGTAAGPSPVDEPTRQLEQGTTEAPRGPTSQDVQGTVVASHDTPYRKGRATPDDQAAAGHDDDGDDARDEGREAS